MTSWEDWKVEDIQPSWVTGGGVRMLGSASRGTVDDDEHVGYIFKGRWAAVGGSLAPGGYHSADSNCTRAPIWCTDRDNGPRSVVSDMPSYFRTRLAGDHISLSAGSR